MTHNYQEKEKKPSWEEFLKMTDEEQVALLEKELEEDKKLSWEELTDKYGVGMEDE